MEICHPSFNWEGPDVFEHAVVSRYIFPYD